MKRQSVGFTIVELLIVIVVIAVLAAITIVAYNGIQERARISRASSHLTQVIKKITLWQVENPGTTPANLNDAGITNSGGTTYQYRRYDNNTTYCVSVTFDSGQSYYANSTSSSAVSTGSCTDVASVAGVPLASISTPSSIISFSTLSGTPDIVMYAVFQINNTSGNFDALALLKPTTSGANWLGLYTMESGSTSTMYRYDTSLATNVVTSQSNTRTAGKHIGWVQVRNSMTTREFGFDQAAPYGTSSMSAGAGWSFNQFQLGPSNASTAPIAAVVYNATHDQQTRGRVMQWLAETYSVPMTF